MRFRHTPDLITGSIAALITPFTDAGGLDEGSLTSQVAWQIKAGSNGLSISGSTGEPSAQSADERARAIRTIARLVDDRVPFLVGTGSAKLDETPEPTEVAPETAARLFRDFENVVGRKETTRGLEHLSRVKATCGNSPLEWSGVELLELERAVR